VNDRVIGDSDRGVAIKVPTGITGNNARANMEATREGAEREGGVRGQKSAKVGVRVP
jgi:hypothetical protein